MKAALVNEQGIVENVVVWDDTCTAPNGLSAVVVDDDAVVSVGWAYANGQFVTNEPARPEPTYAQLRAAEYPPITDYLDGVVKGDQAQIDAYIAACQAVKAKYPKP